MIVLRNILVATDFSEPSAVALAYGRDLARSYECALHVLHIVQDVAAHYSPEVVVPPETQVRVETNARADLERLITEDDRRTLKIIPCVETRLSVPAGITDYAKEHSVDLVIVGTHGRGPIRQFFMGSVAERVVRTAPCPVLTVRAQEREFIAPDALTKTRADSSPA
jgi:universal stress protein A